MNGSIVWHPPVGGAMYPGKKWRGALWLSVMYSGKNWWTREFGNQILQNSGGLIFGGACIQWRIEKRTKVCVTVPFLLSFILYLREVSKDILAPGTYVRRRDLTEGFFFALRVWGTYIWRGIHGMAHFPNVTVIFHLATFRGIQR